MDTNFMSVEIEKKKMKIEQYRQRIEEEQEKDKPDSRLISAYISQIGSILDTLEDYQKIKNHLDTHL